jgi:hypothetical protein
MLNIIAAHKFVQQKQHIILEKSMISLISLTRTTFSGELQAHICD